MSHNRCAFSDAPGADRQGGEGVSTASPETANPARGGKRPEAAPRKMRVSCCSLRGLPCDKSFTMSIGNSLPGLDRTGRHVTSLKQISHDP